MNRWIEYESGSLEAQNHCNSLFPMQLMMRVHFLINDYYKVDCLLTLEGLLKVQPSDEILIARIYLTQIGRRKSHSPKLDQQIGS